MHILSVREHPASVDTVIAYFQSKWAVEPQIYEDCIRHSLTTPSPLPQWYLLYSGQEIIGCTGLITNDFISRMDLWPWLCALYIDKAHRGKGYSRLLVEHCKAEARRLGFTSLYLCTDHAKLYERFGFAHIGTGYHPWGESSRIYAVAL